MIPETSELLFLVYGYIFLVLIFTLSIRKKITMTQEFHQPFIKALVTVAVVTIFAMISTKLVINHYGNFKSSGQKTVEYSSYEYQNSTKHAD
jgi:glucan phosphoethanolaminetransferase (alkaline phosphatase superfamily)